MKSNGGNRYPYWVEKIEDEIRRGQAINILNACKRVQNMNRQLGRTQSDGDRVDLEAAKLELKDVLVDVYETGENDNNPLWDIVMQIRPQVIGARLSVFYTQMLAEAMRQIKKEVEKDGHQEKADFFRKLANQQIDVPLIRAVISGGSVGERLSGNGVNYHYLPGIPPVIRRKVGVKLTTKLSENKKLIIEAYETMRDNASGHARDAMEAHLADIKNMFELLENKAKK